MDPIALIGAGVAILAFLWALLFGQRSLFELKQWWRELRKQKPPSTSGAEPTPTSQAPDLAHLLKEMILRGERVGALDAHVQSLEVQVKEAQMRLKCQEEEIARLKQQFAAGAPEVEWTLRAKHTERARTLDKIGRVGQELAETATLARTNLIDRERELSAIRQAIAGRTSLSVFCFTGPGGIGKTRLLEEIGNPAGLLITDGLDFIWSGIIDLYHPEPHSNLGMERTIINGLSDDVPEIEPYFEEYWEERKEFERLRREMIGAHRLEALQAQLTRTFVQSYNKAAAQRRIVLAFDTTEFIQFESDPIQRICQLEGEYTGARTWLMDVIPEMQNTVVLLAGRLQEDLLNAFQRAFGRRPWQFQVFSLNGFKCTEAQAYFEQIARRVPTVHDIPQEDLWTLWQLTDGRPVRLALAIDLSLHGDIEGLFPPFAEGGAETEVTWEQIEARLIQSTSNLHMGYPVSTILSYLAATRLGLDAPLLHCLEPNLSLKECEDRLARLSVLSFIKTRPATDSVFLHDEMYDLLEKHVVFPARQDFVEMYHKIADYYEDKLSKTPGDEELEQDLKVRVLHHRLRANPRQGYEKYYTRWSEMAIKGHQLGFDMRLRDELLRVFNVPANQRLSDLQGLPRDAIDRDFAVCWVKRCSAKAQYSRAIEVAQTILAFGPEPYRSLVKEPSKAARTVKGPLPEDARRIFGVDDPLFWAHLLATYSEVLLFHGAPEAQARQLLDKALELLATREEEDYRKWWRTRILARAYNRLGYAHWVTRRYRVSNEYNHTALHYYRQLDIRDEMAETLNNAAYIYALLGDISKAEKWIDDALELRRELGQGYPLALSLNTRGLIHVMAGEPHRALVCCQEALSICQSLEDWRGQGLAYNALGLVYRKLGNLSRLGLYKFDQAVDFYEKAGDALHEAIRIFKEEVPERIRLVEAHNELGSVYRDWAILLMSVQALSSFPGETLKRIHRDTQTGGFQAKAMAQIFLCYAREDKEKVEKLYQKLSEAGFRPWMAQKDIFPGEQWKSRIPQAIRSSDFFLACLSATSVNKRSFIQREIKDALDIWQEKLDSDIYLIPVRMEDCEVPEGLRDFQWLNLFEEDGWTRLVKAIQVGMERQAAAPKEGPKRVVLLQEAGQEEEATQLFEQALANYEEAVRTAGDDWPVDRADSYEDMADVFALQGQLDRAEEYLEKVEALVPDEYRLVEGEGFREITEPVEGFWQIMGKVHLARGHNISRPIRGLESLTEEQEAVLLKTVEQYALATAYFLQYSPHLGLHKDIFEAIYDRLKRSNIERLEKVEKQVLKIASRFKVDLSPLMAELDETLGLKAPLLYED